MDRTREFQLIVQSTEIPQKTQRENTFYLEVDKKYKEIAGILSDLSKLTSYDSYKMQSLLTRGYTALNEYKQFPIDENVTGDYKEVINSLKSIIKNNSLKTTLKLNELSRKLAREQTKVESHATKRNNSVILDEQNGQKTQNTFTQAQQAVFMDEVQENKQKDEFLSERRRIVKSITEIGQIVEDIAIHVCLQEEQLKRIDEVVAKSEHWSKKALNEIRETWEMTSANTKTMAKFFIFWICLFLLFWFVKR